MAEFFHRGPKISDMSNRYEQHCKRCNEHFPKGRQEAMVLHLTKKCPAVDNIERAKIIFRLHDLAMPDVHPNIDPANAPVDPQPPSGNEDYSQSGAPIARPPLQGVQGIDRLSVLAEVSRQEVSRQEVSRRTDRDEQVSGYTFRSVDQVDDMPLDPQLETGDFHTTAHLQSTGGDFHSLVTTSMPVSTAASFTAPYSYVTEMPTNISAYAVRFPMVSAGPADLPTLAASTVDMPMTNVTMVDLDMHTALVYSPALPPELQGHAFSGQGAAHLQWRTTPPAQPHNQVMFPSQDEHMLNQALLPPAPTTGLYPPILGASNQHLRPIAISQATEQTPPAENTIAPDSASPKQNVRAKFGPSRRDEIRAVRSVGACLRCRMLRKPCSQETPCHTCAVIEAPRLFKLPCLRTKLEEQFPLYSTLPHSNRSDREVKNLHVQGTFKTDAGVLEVSHNLSPKILLKAYKINHFTRPDFVETRGRKLSERDLVVLDLDSDSMVHKVPRYLQEMTALLIEAEQSSVMKASLQMAQFLSDQQDSKDKSGALLPGAIELWAATVLITDTHLTVLFASSNGTGNGQTQIGINADPDHYETLTTQLRAAIEKRANNVCRELLQEFERRIVFRNKGINFETILAAFITLNCVERMLWLYKQWPLLKSQHDFGEIVTSFTEETNSFVSLFLKLLSVRRMEIQVVEDPVNKTLIARDSKDTGLTTWLAAVGFTTNIGTCFGPGVFNSHDSRSLDGTFSSRILHVGRDEKSVGSVAPENPQASDQPISGESK